MKKNEILRYFQIAFATYIINLFLLSTSIEAKAFSNKPNVLFIAVDDLNDWILGENPRIMAPNISKLAERGILFTKAYCSSPACNPSRTAILTGKQPYTTGVYGNNSDWQKALPDVITLPKYFRENGYLTAGAGKIFHHVERGAFHDHEAFNEYFPYFDEYLPYKKLNGLEGYINEDDNFEWVSNTFDWGVVPYSDKALLDVQSVNWASDFLKKSHNKPFFLAIGLFRPHLPYFAPKEYFEKYPLSEIELPTIESNDLADVPRGGIKLLNYWQSLYRTIEQGENKNSGTFKKAIQAYKASATFADHQIGELIKALDKSQYAKNTIIVLWSDHGYHLGEKQHWTKFVLWERATRVPFLIIAPGLTSVNKQCDRPVSLIDLYPTLIELCNLPFQKDLDGNSLYPLLRDPDATWDHPAIMTYLPGNYAIRTDKWRYIRYADGTEELYNMDNDPNEWKNLAGEAEMKTIINDLKKYIPNREAIMVKDYKSWRSLNK
jgi:choline-sulfatase